MFLLIVVQGVGLVLAQFDGLMAGYEAAAPKNMPLKLFDFQVSELPDVTLT